MSTFMLVSLGKRSSWWSNVTMSHLRFIFSLRLALIFSSVQKQQKHSHNQKSQKHFHKQTLILNQVIVLIFILS